MHNVHNCVAWLKSLVLWSFLFQFDQSANKLSKENAKHRISECESISNVSQGLSRQDTFEAI